MRVAVLLAQNTGAVLVAYDPERRRAPRWCYMLMVVVQLAQLRRHASFVHGKGEMQLNQ